MYKPLTTLCGSFMLLQHKQTYQSLQKGRKSSFFFSSFLFFFPVEDFKYSLKIEIKDPAYLPN